MAKQGRVSARQCKKMLISQAATSQGSCLVGPVDPSFRALSGCLKFTDGHHQFNKDSLSCLRATQEWRSSSSGHRVHLGKYNCAFLPPNLTVGPNFRTSDSPRQTPSKRAACQGEPRPEICRFGVIVRVSFKVIVGRLIKS